MEIDKTGLLAYFPFNGDADDFSGNGHHGTVHGATLTDDRNGNPSSAYSFDGDNDYIDIGVIDIGLPVTVALWFSSSSINEKWDTLVGYNLPVKPYNGIQIMANGDGKLRFRMGGAIDDIISESVIDGDGKWHHIAIKRDLSNKVELFVDGELESSSTSNDSIGESHNLFFGKSFQPDKLEEYFAGKIDEIRIYNRSLSETEIKHLYENEYIVSSYRSHEKRHIPGESFESCLKISYTNTLNRLRS